MTKRKVPGKYRNIGLLILRAGLGMMLILHGIPKLFGGPEMWEQVGTATQAIAINFLPAFFGFLAGAAEFFGGIFLIVGLFFRPTLSILVVVMVVAAAESIAIGEGFEAVSHPIEIGIVFIALLFTGPGKYNLDKKMKRRRRY